METGATALQVTEALASHGLVVGFGDDGPARIHAAYPSSTWDRLAAIKAAYDPSNLFRLNHNVPPAG